MDQLTTSVLQSETSPTGVFSPVEDAISNSNNHVKKTNDNAIIFENLNNRLAKSIADYDDMDEAMVDVFFIEVLNSTDPAELIPFALYETWKDTIESSPYYDHFLSDIALQIGISWPTTRHEEKISDYLKYDIASLSTFPGFGRKKSRTLLLCMAYSAYKANKAKFTSYARNESIEALEIYSSPSYEDLLTSERPASKITAELWGRWCQSIDTSSAKFTKISEIAHKLHLNWPYSKRNECFAEYVSLPLTKVQNLPGFGLKKIRTLILCIASLGLAPPSVESPESLLEHGSCSLLNSPSIDLEALAKTIQETLSELPPNKQIIIQERFGINCEQSLTLEEIAVQFGITRERVRQIVKGVIEGIKCTELGKLLPSTISKLETEAIWLHLSNQYGVTHLSLQDLTTMHNGMYPAEPCSTRDAEIVMREAPHLFVSMCDKGWCMPFCLLLVITNFVTKFLRLKKRMTVLPYLWKSMGLLSISLFFKRLQFF